MEVALIAPGSLQHLSVNRKFEMIIPEGVHHDSRYKTYFSHEGRSDKYTMLDNGAFEQAQVTDHNLLELAAMYQVDEVAAPDVIGDVYQSLNKLESFLYMIESYQDFQLRIMAVVQGQNLRECKSFITYIASTQHANTTWTLAFPKHLVKTTGHFDARLRLIRWTQREYNHLFQIHALGYNYPGEVQGLAGLGVRSLDTSAPFIAAYHRYSLQNQSEIDPRSTIPDYWNLPADQFDSKLVEKT